MCIRDRSYRGRGGDGTRRGKKSIFSEPGRAALLLVPSVAVEGVAAWSTLRAAADGGASGAVGWGPSPNWAANHSIFELSFRASPGGFGVQFKDPGPRYTCEVLEEELRAGADLHVYGEPATLGNNAGHDGMFRRCFNPSFLQTNAKRSMLNGGAVFGTGAAVGAAGIREMHAEIEAAWNTRSIYTASSRAAASCSKLSSRPPATSSQKSSMPTKEPTKPAMPSRHATGATRSGRMRTGC